MNKALLLLFGLGLAACSAPNEDLQEWMKNTQTQAKAKVHKPGTASLGKRASYTPPTGPVLNDFDPARLKAAMQQGSNGPNLRRAKEILENFSLENLRYVGSVSSKSKSTVAFISVEGHVYTVRIGNYLGQNYGRITAITPDKLVITEQVEDTYGNWTNRRVTMPLQQEADDTKDNTNNAQNNNAQNK